MQHLDAGACLPVLPYHQNSGLQPMTWLGLTDSKLIVLL